MNKIIKILDHIVMLFFKWIELRRINPYVKVGLYIFASGFTLLGGFAVKIKFFNKNANGSYQDITVEATDSGVSNDIINYIILTISIILMVIGIILCILGLNNVNSQWKNKVFYYVTGLENQSIKHPIYALPKMSKYFTPILSKLDIDNNSVQEMYDSTLFNSKIISKKINQNESDEIYFAGLARVPVLFFLGYSFRNAHSSITLLEHNHQSTKWSLLEGADDCNKNIIVTGMDSLMPNNEEVSVLIEFTCRINDIELPIKLNENIIRIQLNKSTTHNQICSSTTLDRIVDSIIKVLIGINKKTKNINLFIAAQSSFVFSLGRRYQDGMIGNIQIHNYDSIKKTYPWSYKLDNKNIKLIEV